MIKLAVFDLDGTIIDTINDIHNSLQYTLRYFGFKEFDRETTRKYVGNGITKLIERSVGKESYKKEIEDFFRKRYGEHIAEESVFFDGFDLVLKYLKEKIKHSAILSNKSFDLTDKIVKHFNLDNVFCKWFGGDSFKERKPSPVGLNYLMNEFGIDKKETIMIGDSYTDVECGYNAKVNTCFCKYGYGKLREIKADCEADKPVDIVKVMESF